MSSEFWAAVVGLILAQVLVSALKKVWGLIREPVPAQRSGEARARDTESSSEARARDLVSGGKKIQAIKMIRELRGITLTEAKDWADNVESGRI